MIYEKLIATGEIFSSLSEFQDALEAFSEQTFQFFSIEDSKRLEAKVNPDSQLKFKILYWFAKIARKFHDKI